MADEEQIETTSVDTPVETTPPDTGSANDGRSERRSLREELQNSFSEARKSDESREERGEKRDQFGRFVEGNKPPPRKPIQATTETAAAPTETADPTPETTEPAATPQEPTSSASSPPVGWPKEAKNEWQRLPPTVQAAVSKREQDTQKGVDELKKRYEDIDKTLAPHLEAIRRHGHTPAQAVGQLFSWFEALAQNPDQAFPALAKSFNYDLAKSAGTSSAPAAATPAQTNGQAGEQTQEPSATATNELNPQLKQMIDQITQKVTGLEFTFAQQNEAKTQEVLNLWSKDKPHFTEVRGMMAQLIASGAIPLKDGRVDLDGAYEAAIWAHPEVRAKVLAAQTAAHEAKLEEALEKKQRAQQEAANKARRAAVSLAPAAPSAGAGKGAIKKGKSVRDSLKDAMDELSA